MKTGKRATYADLEAVPDTKVAEIIEGELIVSPRPAPRHSAASSGITGELWGKFQVGRGGPGGWWILDEPELHLGENVLVPDLAGWRKERMPELPETAFFGLAPDWICEVVSPSTESLDRTRKLRLYAVAGVKHAWLVNPITRTLEVFRLENGRWALLSAHADDALVRAEPFETAEVDLLLIWGGTRQP